MEVDRRDCLNAGDLREFDEIGIAPKGDSSASKERIEILFYNSPYGAPAIKVIIEKGLGRLKTALEVVARLEFNNI